MAQLQRVSLRSRRSGLIKLWPHPVTQNANVVGRMLQIQTYLNNRQSHRAKAAADALHPLAPLDTGLMKLRADCALATGDFHDAIVLFERALTQTDLPALWAGKGAALRLLRHFRQAASCFQRAAALDAANPIYVCEAADCLINAGQPQDGLDTLMNAHPDVRVCMLRAQALREIGCYKSAFENAALAARDDESGAALQLARKLARTEQDDVKIAEVCTPLVGAPKTPAQLRSAAIAPQYPYLTQRVSEYVLDQLATQKLTNDQSAACHHMLFRHFDHIDERTTAKHHLQDFHSLKRQFAPYKSSADSALFTTLMRLRFTPLRPSKSSVLPIFVTGLPGSGRKYASHLLERASASVPARPLHLVEAVMTRFLRHIRASGSRDVTRNDLLGLQAELRAGLVQASNGDDIVIDSSTMNFRWSGLISAALPEARIAHMKRDNMQTGWAMYSRELASSDLRCRHDLQNISAFQSQSRQLMHHWEQSAPSTVFAVSGTALCRASGQTARALVEACQLKWSESCILRAETNDPKWHRYADLLTPLRNTPHDNGASIAL